MIRYNRILHLMVIMSLQSCVPALPHFKNAPSEALSIPDDFDHQEWCEPDCQASNLAKENISDFFAETDLVALIDVALTHNQEINILEQRIHIANNAIAAKQGEYLPRLGIGAGYEYEKVGEFTSQGQSDAVSNVPETLNKHHVGLNASWEIDIWKKLRHSAKSAYYEYLSSIEGKKFATTQLVSEVAAHYYEMLALDKKLDIINENITTLKKVKEVLQLQKIAARSNALAIKRYNAELLKNQSRKVALLQARTIVENRLNNLVGRLPQKMHYKAADFLTIKVAKASTGIPRDLLNNRSDIREAALKLKAAKFDVKSVKARFYPSLSIDANIGYQAFNASHLLDSPASLFYNMAGSISAPLLNRKVIKADYFSANNRQIQAIYEYEKTFIRAYTEVLNQLISLQNFQKMYAIKEKEIQNLESSVAIANVLFKAARIDYLESLLTKREYLEAKMELVEVKQKHILSYIHLYKALGGGWKNKPSSHSTLIKQ